MFNGERLKKNFWSSEINQMDLLPKFGRDTEDKPIPKVTIAPSFLGIRFDKGIVFASETLVAYLTLLRYQNAERIFKLSENILFTGSGDYADIQALKRTFNAKIIDDECQQMPKMSPRALTAWLTRVFYYRRSIMNPFDVTLGVGGLDEDKIPYLAAIDQRGCCYEDFVVASGLAAHMAMPMVREAAELVRASMEIMFNRDTQTIGTYAVGICTEDYCGIRGRFKVAENWDIALNVLGK